MTVSRITPGLMTPVIRPERPSADQAPKVNFAEELGKLLDAANTSQLDAARIQDAFMNGEPVELHQVMIKAEEAGLTLDLLLEIRNRLLNAYKDVISMPL